MDCGVTRDWLLQAERPGDLAAAPPAVAEHARSCKTCEALAERLARIEECYRDEPLPASVTAGRDAFLHRLAATPATPVRRGVESQRWAVAALILMAFGLATLLMGPTTPARASDVVDRLIEWNVHLADATANSTTAARFAAAVPGLTADLDRVADGERELAETLLENGRWLAAHDDPVETATRMHDVADRLFDRLRKATARGDARQSQQFARNYQRVTERSLDASLDRAAAVATLTPKQREKLAAIERKAAERQQALAALHEAMPTASKKELRKALESSRKKPKAKQQISEP